MIYDNYEDFTPEQMAILEKYVSNTRGNIFVLKNIPEVIKGALFSRYSRSSLGLRSLLLKEFIENQEESAFQEILGETETLSCASHERQGLAIKRAQSFYDRILDGYGDDSIAELGGAHLAIENISMLAAKMIENNRIGGSPLEKSTRYIYFDQKIRGQYLFYREPVLMTSAYRDLYVETCNSLFDTYTRLISKLTTKIEATTKKEPHISSAAYAASIRAKVLDCLRGLLPAGALTNMGLYGNGRFFEGLIHKMQCHNLAEIQENSKKIREELAKVIPSFIRRADPSHHTHQQFATFHERMEADLKKLSQLYSPPPSSPPLPHAQVNLIDEDPDAVYKIAAALLFRSGHHSLAELTRYCKQLGEEELAQILDAAALFRENRRHKSPRALEQAYFTFEIIADFGAYRDLHRHRLLTQERQLLSCHYGYYLPAELSGTPMEREYIEAMEKSKIAYDTIAKELPEEAQYVVPMAYHLRWYFRLNLRALQWICELRSTAAGHPSYRHIAQEMARVVCMKYPPLERFFKFVDFEGYELGRLKQEHALSSRQRSDSLA